MRAPGPVIVLSTTCNRDPFLSPWRLRCSSSDFLVERSIPNTISCENVAFFQRNTIWHEERSDIFGEISGGERFLFECVQDRSIGLQRYIIQDP